MPKRNVKYAWESWRAQLRMTYIMEDKEMLCKLIEDGPEQINQEQLYPEFQKKAA